MNNLIQNHLEQIADLMDFMGENQFKVGAFRNAARIVASLEGDIAAAIESGELAKTKGIGKSTLQAIVQFVDDGSSQVFEELTENVPMTIFELFAIRGLGPKKVQQLYYNHHIANIAQLNVALKEGRLRNIPGFGEKLLEGIKSEILRIGHAKNFIYIDQANVLTDHIQHHLSAFESFLQAHVAGELALIKEVYSKLEFVVLVKNKDEFIEQLGKRYSDFSIIEATITVYDFEVPVLLYLEVDAAEYSEKIVNFTVQPNLHELYEKLADQYPEISTFPFPLLETEYYLAEELKIPLKASNVSLDSLEGMFHFHTQWSDGVHTLREMISTGKKYGYSYFAVCDHSKAAFYANGLTAERVLLQRDEILQVSAEIGVPVLSGIEADILTDGELDYEDSFLRTFDLVVASIHSQFQLSEADQTARIIKAVENPHVHILGHPTGRLLLRRDGYKVNMRKVIDACAANNTAIEINSNPLRLDLDWRWLPYASEKGCKFSINADAHSMDNIHYIHYGLQIAQKGGLQQEQILNCFSMNELKQFTGKD